MRSDPGITGHGRPASDASRLQEPRSEGRARAVLSTQGRVRLPRDAALVRVPRAAGRAPRSRRVTRRVGTAPRLRHEAAAMLDPGGGGPLVPGQRFVAAVLPPL